MRYKHLEENGVRKNSTDSGKTDNLVPLCAGLGVSKEVSKNMKAYMYHCTITCHFEKLWAGIS